jgi:hypothetical protein
MRRVERAMGTGHDPFELGSPVNGPHAPPSYGGTQPTRGYPGPTTAGAPFDPQPPGRGAPYGGFADTATRPAPAADAVGSPPLGWLVAALVIALAAAATAFVLRTSVVAAAICWAAAGPLAIGMVARYSVADTRQQARVVYTRRAWASGLYWGTVVVLLVAVVVCAWPIADWAGRR